MPTSDPIPDGSVTVTRGREAFPGATDDLPPRVRVDQHGHYWRDFGSHWSMPAVSDENVDTVTIATYVRQDREPSIVERLDAIIADLEKTGNHELIRAAHVIDGARVLVEVLTGFMAGAVASGVYSLKAVRA